MNTASGSVVDGRYEVEKLLGEGGMGVVLVARHKFTGARVALKMLHAHLRLRPDLAARFLAEARAPAAIGHPGIVSVTDAGITPEGDPYFAMELLAGEPLSALMRRGPMPFETIRRICIEILDALGAAHGAGFIHRDLKPENVFVQTSGSIKLLDFGIAKSLGDLDSGVGTATGVTMGTLFYMSPEQLRNAKRVDHRTDIWALGVMLYQMVSGQLPYEAESLGDMLMLVLNSPPRPLGERLREVPPELDQVLRRALSTDPAQRYGSAAEMRQALAALPATELRYHTGIVPAPVARTAAAAPAMTTAAPSIAPAPSRARIVAPAIAGVGVLIAIGALLLAVGIVIGIFFWRRPHRGPPPRPPEGQNEAPAARATENPLCERVCKQFEECGGVIEMKKCVDDCVAAPLKMRKCLKEAGTSCDEIGACSIENECGEKPHGAKSCQAVANCQGACGVNKKPCVCACDAQLAPDKASELAINNSCALVRCNSECGAPRANMPSCLACFVKKCKDEGDQCQKN